MRLKWPSSVDRSSLQPEGSRPRVSLTFWRGLLYHGRTFGNPLVTRPKTTFRCQQCGYQFPRQLGRCPECKSWNSMQEERTPELGKGRPRAVGGPSGHLPLAEIEYGLE